MSLVAIKLAGKMITHFLFSAFYLLGRSSSLALGTTGSTLLGLLEDGRTGDGLVLLSENDLHVARVGHEGVDASVGAVQATADLGGSIDLDVGDVELVEVQVLERSVGLSILEQVQEELAGLLGPAGEGAREMLVLLGLSSAANSSDGAAEGDGVLVVQDALQESLSLLKSHSTDGVSGGMGVLEVDTQVGTLGLGGCFTEQDGTKPVQIDRRKSQAVQETQFG
jgi:hypothetical protein